MDLVNSATIDPTAFRARRREVALCDFLVTALLIGAEMISPLRKRSAQRQGLIQSDLLVAAAIFAAVVAAAIAQPAKSLTPTPSIGLPAFGRQLAGAPTAALQPAAMQSADDAAASSAAQPPFDSAPLELARPFVVQGSALDKARALLCLTQAVYYEAGFEPVDGRRAVAQVILNRVRHPAFPHSICRVVYQGAGSGTCQFSFVCNGDLDRRPAAGAWLQAEQVASDALSGYVDPAVGEATHYHADYVAPRWAPSLARVAAIGRHIFYRWPGAWGQRAAFTAAYSGEPEGAFDLRGGPSIAAAEVPSEPAMREEPEPRSSAHVGYSILALLEPAPGQSGRRGTALPDTPRGDGADLPARTGQ